jgi:two-component system sensor histidine kinase HydH
LKQVLLNLYLNAIHAIDHDGVITVAASECGDGRVKVSVADSGKGMTAEQLQAIFTPYYTTRADGTGLGLAVVQNIIEQHGGIIHAESAPGKGAVFTLFLPVNGQQKDEQG